VRYCEAKRRAREEADRAAAERGRETLLIEVLIDQAERPKPIDPIVSPLIGSILG
jgi:hypothetical protein